MALSLKLFQARQVSVPAWAEAFNLAGPRAITARWAWAVLALGTVAALGAGLDLEQAEAEHDQASADVQRLQRARHQQQVAMQAQTQSRQTPQPGTPATALSADQTARAAQVVAWLAYPWPAHLTQADAAANEAHALMVSWQLDLSGWNGQLATQPAVRLSAVVADDAAALRWAQVLGPQAQLISRAALSAPLPTARGPYTARAELSWVGGTP